MGDGPSGRSSGCQRDHRVLGEPNAYELTPPRCRPQTLAPVLDWDVPHQVSIRPLTLNPQADLELSILVSQKLDPSNISCDTLILSDGAINRGDIRPLSARVERP